MQLALLGAALVAILGLCAFTLMRARADGAAAQRSTDLTQTSNTDDAMLQAGAAAPHDPAALDGELRAGRF